MANILKCKKCGDIITSDERHDMNWCKCGAIAIDGGDDYCKITGNPEDMEVFVPSKLLKEKEKEIELMDGHIKIVNRTVQQYSEKCKNLEIETEHWFKLVEEKNNQLAEKEKELKRIKKNWELSKGQQRRLYDSLKLRCKDALEQIDQDKISFAVEQLEMVKNIIHRLDVAPDEINKLTIALDNYSNGFHKSRYKVINIIDNQIKTIKEMK